MTKGTFQNKLTFIVVLVILSSSFTVSPAQSQSNDNIPDESTQGYINFFSFGITQNSHFIDFGFPGNGSESNPYVIENLKIITDEDVGIYIGYTTKHFILRDCKIDAYRYGIIIYNVAPGTATIYNNTCNNIKGGTGIIVSTSPNITVSDNLCENNYQGIIVTQCANATLMNNECGFNSEPFSISFSPHSYIFNNSADFCSSYGIYVYQSNHTVIANNTVFKIGSNSYYNDEGIYLIYCYDVTVKYNEITESGRNIYMFAVLASQIYENILIGGGSYGIYVDWYSYEWPSAYNIFHRNYFIENCQFYNNYWFDPQSQAFDRGLDEIWFDPYTNVGNYWSNYTGSGVYNVDGGRFFFDPYPIAIVDSDSDGLDDIQEIYAYHTDVYDNDTDNDMLLDGEEVFVYFTNPLRVDTDYDGLTDGEEVLIYNTLPTTQDSDADQLKDGEEVLIYGTNPRRRDTDQDDIPDGWEVMWGLDPLVVDSDEDPDGDGLLNLEEYEESTEPLNDDTDEDFLIDGDEVHIYFTSPLNNDTDDDGALDGVEVHDYGCDPRVKDTDGDNLNDGREINEFFTNPCVKDTDLDGCDDGWEVKYKFNPLDPSDANEDPDDDDLTNAEEFYYGTNPLKWDTDEDEFSDGQEVRAGTDPLLITDHPMAREDVIKMGVGIGLGSAFLVGVTFYILIKKKIIRFKKKK